MPDLIPIRRALLSVSDKRGIVDLARTLHGWGVELISTGGTAAALRDAGLPVVTVSEVTGFPEIMDGRVKTLHPAIHGGLLGDRGNESHMAAMGEHGIAPIDLVVINLYPFERTVGEPGVSHERAIEQIDIGGPAMLRGAAKNADSVAVCVDPDSYSALIEHLSAHEDVGLGAATTRVYRRALARRVFAVTAAYDAAIAGWLERSAAGEAGGDGGGGGAGVLPERLVLNLERVRPLRYGENPHQGAAVYRNAGTGVGAGGGGVSIVDAPVLHGKPLSYNNLNDASAAVRLAIDLHALDPTRVSAVVVKHTNPCGAATGDDALSAVDAALAGDPLAAFGGILAVSRPVDRGVAERLCAEGVFLEVLIAPSCDDEALATLQGRWANLRILTVGGFPRFLPEGVEVRTIPGGALAQVGDGGAPCDPGSWRLGGGPTPSPEVVSRAAVVWTMCKHLTSNAIAIGGSDPDRAGVVRLFGAGAGQMDRVTAARLAAEKAGEMARGAIAASDAFFPFPDGPGRLIEAGVGTIVQPGGAKRDQETFDLCDARGVTCLLTGTRHFRH
ncbi:MAG: bifunctional phosphoribosylaminoimidazolecarboxamide formyltransferase/IMP cyclohydrolase [Phycisphaerales bacterium]